MAKPKLTGWDFLPPEVRKGLEPAQKAAERASKPPPKRPLSVDQKDANVRQKPPALPYNKRPGMFGSPIAGPPVPITPRGTKVEPVPSTEIKHAGTALQSAQTAYKSTVPQVKAASTTYDSSLAAAKKASEAWTTAMSAAQKRYGVNARGGVTLPAGATEQFQLLNHLQDAAKAAMETYTNARDSYKSAYANYQQADEQRHSALETFGTTIERAQEFGTAQRTGGVLGAPPKPTKEQLHDYVEAGGDKRTDLTPEQIAYYDLARFHGNSLLGRIGGPLAPLKWGWRGIGTALEQMPIAQVPVPPGEKPKYAPGMRPYDVGGTAVGTAKGLSALGAAIAVPTGKKIYYSGQKWMAGLDPTGKAQVQLSPEAQQAGIVPTKLAESVGGGALKVLGGGAIATASLTPLAYAMGTDQLTQAERTLRQGVQILRGVTQEVGLAASLFDPKTSWADKYDLSVEQIVKPTLLDLQTKYGSDVTLQQLYEGAKKEPLIYGMNGVALISGISKVITGLYALNSASSLGEVLRAIHNPANERLLTLRGAAATTIERPDLPRRFGVGSRPPVRDQLTGEPFLTPEGGAIQVPTTWPRSPAIRTFVSRPYDQLSRFIEGKDKLRRIPVVRLISENSRAARQLQRNNDRERRRLPAWAQGMLKSVEHYLKGQPEMKLALSLLLQKPSDFTDEEWLDAILTNLKHMEATGEFIGPEGRPTPAAAQLIASIRRNEGRSDAARVKRQGRAARNISADQLRLGHALDRLAAERAQLLEERRRYQADPEQSDADKALLVQEIDLELRANTAQRDVARQSLQDLTIHLDPVEGEGRDRYRAELAKVPHIGGGEARHDLALPVVRPATTHVVQPDPTVEAPPMMGHTRLYRTDEGWTPDREHAEQQADEEGVVEHVDLTIQEARALPAPDDNGMLQLPSAISARAETANAHQMKLWDEYEALRDKDSPRTPVEKRRFKELDKYFRQPRSKAAIEADRARLIDEAIARRDILLGSQEGQLVDDGMMISDLFARRWGQNYNRNPADWYDEAVTLRYTPEGEGIPEDAFLQKRSRKRPPAVGMKTSPKLGRGYWNQTHRDRVADLERKEARFDAAKQRVKDDERKADNDPSKITEKSDEYKTAKAEHDFAKEIELEARVWYGSETFRGTVTRNPERRALARRLLREYGGRKGALPTRFRTADGLERMMSVLDELTTQGEHAQHWYEHSAEAILRLSHGDKKLAAKLAQLVAIYSPQKAVIPNLGEAIKAYASWRSSKPITNGQEWQHKAAQKVLDETDDWDGRKTNNFYRNFLEDIDPAFFKAERARILGDPDTKLKDRKAWEGGVTSDMWMARVFGYLGTTVSEGRYDVIEDVVRQLAAERPGWKPKHVQAAIWTAVKDKSDDISANVDFATAISRHYGVVNWEAAPGSTYAGPFAAIYSSWDEPTQRAFLAATVAAVDDFLADAGILARRNDYGPGIFRRSAAPGARFRFVASGRHEPGSKKKEIPWSYDTTPDDRQLYNFVAAAIGRATLQDAMPWVRGFIPKSKGHGDAMFLNLGRRVTDDEAAKLYDILNPDPDPNNERVFVVHAGTEGVLLRKATWLDDWQNYIQRTKVKKGEENAPLYKDSFQGVAEDAIAEVFPDLDPKTSTLEIVATDGEYITNDWAKGSADYDEKIDAALGDAGDSRQALRLRESADRLALQTRQIRDDFEADPDGASLRADDDLGRRDRSAKRRGLDDPAAPRGPPHALAQTRREAVLGATEWLDTAPGQRIIHLTEQADISTLLHELVGHGVYEMKAFHPEEFTRVEERMGRPLEAWTREDHEQFARWAERYFTDGEPPTPELVPVMDRLKAWMRAIYGGMAVTLGPKMPTEVRVLFDTLFGAYDDENVYRIAMNLGRAGRGDEQLGLKAQPKRLPSEDKESYARRLLDAGHSVGPATQGLIENFAAQERLLPDAPDYATDLAQLEAERSELLKSDLTEAQPNYEDLESYDIERHGAAMVLDQQSLISLKRQQDAAKGKRSVIGMRVQLADLEKQMEELKNEPGIDGTKTSKYSAEQARRHADLTARILDERTRLLVREDKRERNLRQRIDLLEKAMSRSFDNRRFQGALYAMQQISKAREEILRETFGRDFDAVFGKNFDDRRDLLADWLVERGLLRPDFQRGTAYYFPYSAEDASLLPPQTAGLPLNGRVVGRTKTDQLNLYKRNQMILWQQGNWNADPAVLMESYLRALSFSWMNEIKTQLWKLGRRLTPEEAGNLGGDVYLVNLNGTPISREVRSQLKPGAEHNPDLSANHDPQAIHDAIDGSDNDRMEHSLKSYWDNFMIDGAERPPDFSLLNPNGEVRNEIRVVPKEVVHALLRPLRGSRTAGGKALDIATTMARFSLIYANAPAYMLSNLTGNLGLLLLTEPWQLAKSMGRARKLLGDPLIAFRIYAETGDLPAFAAISRGRAFDLGTVDATAVLRKGEQKWLRGLSKADQYPRALAWIAEAERLGYRKNDDIIALLDGKTPKTKRDRQTVSEFATNAMIDFNKLRPWEQLYLTRALFIWPFVRGSTAWPFWYAKNYPERAAVLSNVALTAEDRRHRMLEQGGRLPRRMEGLTPLSVHGTGKYRTAQVINASVVSPTSTLMGEAEAAGDVANYILGIVGAGNGNEEPVTALLDMISPVASTILEIATQRNDWGQSMTPGEVLGDVAESFLPFVRLYNAQAGDHPLWGENRSPRAFLEDAGPGDQRRRTFIRILPQTLTIQYANAQGMRHGDKPVEERIAQAEKTSRADWKTTNPGEPWPAGAKRAIVMRLLYEDRVKEYARERASRTGTPPFVPTKVKGTTDEYDFHYHPTAYERAKIAYAVAQKYMPGADVRNPDTMLIRENATPTSQDGIELLEDWLGDDWAALLEPESDITTDAKEIAADKKWEREKKRLEKLGLFDEYNRVIQSKKPLYAPTEIGLG